MGTSPISIIMNKKFIKKTKQKVNLNFSQNTKTFKSFCMYRTIKLKEVNVEPESLVKWIAFNWSRNDTPQCWKC